MAQLKKAGDFNTREISDHYAIKRAKFAERRIRGWVKQKVVSKSPAEKYLERRLERDKFISRQRLKYYTRANKIFKGILKSNEIHILRKKGFNFKTARPFGYKFSTIEKLKPRLGIKDNDKKTPLKRRGRKSTHALRKIFRYTKEIPTGRSLFMTKSMTGMDDRSYLKGVRNKFINLLEKKKVQGEFSSIFKSSEEFIFTSVISDNQQMDYVNEFKRFISWALVKTVILLAFINYFNWVENKLVPFVEYMNTIKSEFIFVRDSIVLNTNSLVRFSFFIDYKKNLYLFFITLRIAILSNFYFLSNNIIQKYKKNQLEPVPDTWLQISPYADGGFFFNTKLDSWDQPPYLYLFLRSFNLNNVTFFLDAQAVYNIPGIVVRSKLKFGTRLSHSISPFIPFLFGLLSRYSIRENLSGKPLFVWFFNHIGLLAEIPNLLSITKCTTLRLLSYYILNSSTKVKLPVLLLRSTAIDLLRNLIEGINDPHFDMSSYVLEFLQKNKIWIYFRRGFWVNYIKNSDILIPFIWPSNVLRFFTGLGMVSGYSGIRRSVGSFLSGQIRDRHKKKSGVNLTKLLMSCLTYGGGKSKALRLIVQMFKRLKTQHMYYNESMLLKLKRSVFYCSPRLRTKRFIRGNTKYYKFIPLRYGRRMFEGIKTLLQASRLRIELKKLREKLYIAIGDEISSINLGLSYGDWHPVSLGNKFYKGTKIPISMPMREIPAPSVELVEERRAFFNTIKQRKSRGTSDFDYASLPYFKRLNRMNKPEGIKKEVE